MTEHHDAAGERGEHGAELRALQSKVTDALVALEVSGRLAVHAWAALERNDQQEARRFLDEMATRVNAALEKVPDGDDQRAIVAAEARAEVAPIVGW